MALFRFRFSKPLSCGTLLFALALASAPRAHAADLNTNTTGTANTSASASASQRTPRASSAPIASIVPTASALTGNDNTLPSFLRGNSLNAPPLLTQPAAPDVFLSGTTNSPDFPALPQRNITGGATRAGAMPSIFSFLPDTSTAANTTSDARNAQAMLAELADSSATVPKPARGAKPLADTANADTELRAIMAYQNEIFAKADAAGDNLQPDDLQSQLQQLTQRYDKLLRVYPNYVAGLVSYGQLLNIIGMKKEGAALMSVANNLDGSIPLVKNELGNYCAEEGHPLIAFVFYTAAIQLAPREPFYYYQLGTLLTEARDTFLADAPGLWTRDTIDEAMQASFRTAMDLAPDDWRFSYRYGLSYYDLGLKEWEDALQFWRAYEKKLRPGFEQQVARLHQAKILIELRRPDDARKLLDTIADQRLAMQRATVAAALAAYKDNLAHPNPNIEITTGSADDSENQSEQNSNSTPNETAIPPLPPQRIETSAPVENKETIAAAIAKLRAGMTREEVLAVMLPSAPVYGVVYYGGTGTSRIYFQISQNQQLWVDMGGHDEEFRSIMIGAPEPKRPWTRRQGDDIIVE